jgi:UDP-glucose 4-epimerase
VYGRYDNDLQRMSRVIPLFIHRLRRGEPITVYGGEEKVLDFTYVDDCVDGIVRGVEALGERRVANETINLAFGEGNTLVRAAGLIADSLGVEADMTFAPPLVGEVTHYVADIRKARDLLGWRAGTPLADGIPQAVAWFEENPPQDEPAVAEGAGLAPKPV